MHFLMEHPNYVLWFSILFVPGIAIRILKKICAWGLQQLEQRRNEVALRIGDLIPSRYSDVISALYRQNTRTDTFGLRLGPL
jgi:hypothetical protein